MKVKSSLMRWITARCPALSPAAELSADTREGRQEIIRQVVDSRKQLLIRLARH